MATVAPSPNPEPFVSACGARNAVTTFAAVINSPARERDVVQNARLLV